MVEKNKTIWIIMAAVLMAAVILSACASIFAAKGVYEIRAEQAAKSETREDGVTIIDQYEILSTLPISDAYRSGNTSNLSEKEKETLDMASAVLKEIITEDMSPYEKEKAVYDWMTTKLSYDTGILQVIPRTESDCDNPYGVLKYHNAVCVGYATTFRLFMQMLDIPCMVVHNKSLIHTWNLVQLDDAWYHVDIYSDQDVGGYANFNMNDELAANNYDWDRDFFPAATALTYNYGYQNRVIVKDIYQVPQLIYKGLEEKQGSIFLEFPAIDEANAKIVESLCNGAEAAMNDSVKFQALFMQRIWIPEPGGKYVLGISITGYEEEDPAQEGIPAETQKKVEDAVEKAFGDLERNGGVPDEEEISVNTAERLPKP